MLVYWSRLYFSLFLCTRTLTLSSSLIRRRWNLKNSSTKWQSPWRIVELNRRIFLPLPDGMICASVVIIYSDSAIFCLFICASLSLFNSPRHDYRRRSLLMLSLSHCDTYHLNRHMVGCGCHEILIPCSTAVLFSTTFPLISIPRVEGEGEFIQVV